MSTTAKAKWEKYFSHGDVETTIKPKAGKPIYAYDFSGNRIGTFQDGDNILVLRSEQYSPQYTVVRRTDSSMARVNEVFVAKPNTVNGPTENLRIHSDTLIQLGTDGTYKGIDTKVFESASNLITSISEGLQSNWRVSDEIVQWFHNFTSTITEPNFEWFQSVTHSERNELGKYLGELIPGIIALDGGFREILPKRAESFCVPTDPSFSGIDSFFKHGPSVTLISSKYGPGARSSVFTNIVSKGIGQNLDPSEFERLCGSAERAGISASDLDAKRGSKEVLWEHGIHDVLGIKGEDTSAIFGEIRNHVLEGSAISNTSRNIIDRIDQVAEEKVREKLPASATQFFSRTVAQNLNNDPVSLSQMKKILVEKDYVQLSLNIPAWHKGKIDYRVSRSSDAELKISGNKAIIGDIDARHGTLSYELRK